MRIGAWSMARVLRQRIEYYYYYSLVKHEITNALKLQKSLDCMFIVVLYECFQRTKYLHTEHTRSKPHLVAHSRKSLLTAGYITYKWLISLYKCILNKLCASLFKSPYTSSFLKMFYRHVVMCKIMHREFMV